MAPRRRIPTGAGSHFVLTPRTLRFPIDGGGDTLAGELLVNAGGDGAIVLAPPGVKFAPGVVATPMSPVDAVELLRRMNLFRLSSGKPEHTIPPALIRRAKADAVPGIEALVAFPGKLKRYFDGRGSWAGTGLWVSADLECELEMSAAVGYLRKRLTHREAELWLGANDHEIPWSVIGRDGAPRDEKPDQWRVATRGHESAGHRSTLAISWGPTQPEEKPRPAAADRELREAIKRAPTTPPPSIRPPKKTRRPRRGR